MSEDTLRLYQQLGDRAARGDTRAEGFGALLGAFIAWDVACIEKQARGDIGGKDD